MTWEEYYDKFYDWSENTQVNKLSSVESLGSADEVAEVMMELAFHHEDAVNRIARKAIEQKIIFSAQNISDLTLSMDSGLQGQMALQSASAFSEKDIQNLEGSLDDEIIIKLYKAKGLRVPDVFIDDESQEVIDDVLERGKQPTGFFSKMAMAFGIGTGIHQGIKEASNERERKFRVGDHVRVKYRRQEGTVVDINGDLYMVSLKDGGYVDSYTESQLEKAW